MNGTRISTIVYDIIFKKYVALPPLFCGKSILKFKKNMKKEMRPTSTSSVIKAALIFAVNLLRTVNLLLLLVFVFHFRTVIERYCDTLESIKLETEIDLGINFIKSELEDDSDIITSNEINDSDYLIDCETYTILFSDYCKTDISKDDLNSTDLHESRISLNNKENDPSSNNLNQNFSNTETDTNDTSPTNKDEAVINSEAKKILKYCRLCNKGFASDRYFKYHCKTNHEIYFCLKCHEEFDSVSGYNTHLESQGHREEERKCSTCQSRFSCKRDRILHEKAVHLHIEEKPPNDVLKKNRNYKKCTNCDFTTPYNFSLRRHAKLHVKNDSSDQSTNNHNFKCDFCGELLRNRNDFEGHIMKHLGIFKANNDQLSKADEDFKCDFCSKIPMDRRAFEKHIMKHLGIKKRKDHPCESLTDISKKHKKIPKKEKSDIYNADVKINKLNDRLNVSKRIDRNKTECGKCRKRFLNNFSLKLHNFDKH